MTEYFIIIDETRQGPLSKEELRGLPITENTLVWRAGLPDWVKVADLPELSDVVVVDTHYEEVNEQTESRWFAMIDNQQVGPYTIATLVSMGLNQDTPVWRNGMSDWATAKTQPEIMAHLTTPPPHPFGNQPNYGQQSSSFSQPDYGRNNNFGNNPQYNTDNNSFEQNRGYNQQQPPYDRNNGYNNRNNPIRTNWLPWAIAATIVGAFFSCIGAIFGVIGIINANKANALYEIGEDRLADQANNNARIMTVIGFILAGVGLIATGFLMKFPIFNTWGFL